MARRSEDVTMESMQIRMRNFAGKETQYNAKGQRNFLVLLDDETAAAMDTDGWNVKQFNVRDPDEKPQSFLKVKVNLEGEPMPRVVMVTSRGKTRLDKDDVAILDWADISSTDLIISPYHWDVNGKQGITAYLQAGYFTINEDELDLKYADVPDSAQGAVGRDTLDADDLG